MAMIVENFAYAPPPARLQLNSPVDIVERLRRAVREAVGRMREARRLRRAMAALEAVDRRTLKDIGVDRSEIASVVLDRSGERVHRGR